MKTAIVIPGTYSGRTFIPDGPLPDAVGRAELIVVPTEQPTSTNAGGPSFWDAVGKLPPEQQRTAEDIDEQIREERASWGDR
jgi:hypothetical protein